MFHFMFQCFIFYIFRYNPKTCSKKIQNMLEENSKHARRKFKTCSKKIQNMLKENSKHAQRETSETMKLRMKHPYPMFHLSNLLIINEL